MNRVDRLFKILLILQRRKKVRAADLASELEVSLRTIYRDMAALGEMGVPLIATPSEGFALVEGFYMPPLKFTPDEAKALLLGAHLLAAQAEGHLAQAAGLAVEKITHILPGETQTMLAQLSQIIRFFMPVGKFDLDHPALANLQQAITERRLLKLTYHSYHRDEITERTIQPHHLTYSDGTWYVSGYCYLRQDNRSFRLERIQQMQVLKTTFEPILMTPPRQTYLTVQVRFVGQVIPWVRERQHYGFEQDEALLPNGDVIMRYRIEDVQEIRAWLLGWGAQAEVIEPVELRQSILAEAQKLIRLLT